jgi:hypothetical protein
MVEVRTLFPYLKKYNNPFYPYKTQVKLFLAYFILRFGFNEHAPNEARWDRHVVDAGVNIDNAT